MPGKGTEPGPALYPECGQPGMAGVWRHRKEHTRTCAGCREKARLDTARYRIGRYVHGQRRVSAVGTGRRIRALSRIGWPQAEVGRRLGMSGWGISKLLVQDCVNRETAEKVAALYRELTGMPGPSAHARRLAELAGWPGPGDWDDPDDPEAVPACEIETAHREALKAETEYRRRARRAARTPEQVAVDRARQAVARQRRRGGARQEARTA